MIQRFLLRMKNSLWLTPSLYSVFSLLLAIAFITIDTNYYKQFERIFPSILLTSVELAQIILGAIAGSLLTMTTITFSTIMVVLTTYSAQFSPRTLRNFVTSQITMRVLGVFMGGFVYSIFSLLFMKSTIEHPVVSAGVGVLFALICLSYFAYFIHYVATYIQVTNLIALLTEDVLKVVQTKIDIVKKQEHVSLLKDTNLEQLNYSYKTKIYGDKYGYLQLIDNNVLLRIAIEKDQVIEINQKIGQFLSQNQSILTVYHHSKELKVDYQPAITIGSDRSTMQDEAFALKKIVEITLRAVSAGINDPNTAIDCIHHLGLALNEVSKLDGNYIIYHDELGKERVIVPQRRFQEILYTTFYQVIHYGQQDISVLMAIFEALIMIVENNSPKIKNIVWGFNHYILEGIDLSHLRQLDQKNIQDRLSKLKLLCQIDRE